MQTITTKYIPATNTKGARIKATSTSGLSATVSYDDALPEGEFQHIAAVKSLCKKSNWQGKLVAGETKTGFVFVFVNFGERNIFQNVHVIKN